MTDTEDRFPSTRGGDIHRPYTAAADRYEGAAFRQVGESGLYLPPLSLGLWWNFGDNIPFDRQRALLRHAFDRGITHFDLANNYGPPAGSAEINFGRQLREDLGPYLRPVDAAHAASNTPAWAVGRQVGEFVADTAT